MLRELIVLAWLLSFWLLVLPVLLPVARSITSHEMPSAAARSHAACITPTCAHSKQRKQAGVKVNQPSHSNQPSKAKRSTQKSKAKAKSKANNACGTCAPHATQVISLPSLITSADPNGNSKSPVGTCVCAAQLGQRERGGGAVQAATTDHSAQAQPLGEWPGVHTRALAARARTSCTDARYNLFGSKKIVGLRSRIDANSRPFAVTASRG